MTDGIRILARAARTVVPAVGIVGVLMAALMVGFGAVGHLLYDSVLPGYFGTYRASLFTMIQVMTLDSWFSSVGRPLVEYSAWSAVYVLTYVALMAYVLLNLLVGIIVEGVSGATRGEDTRRRGERIARVFDAEGVITIRALLAELHLPAERRSVSLESLYTRLELSPEEVHAAVHADPRLRLRACRERPTDDLERLLLIERFPGNAAFGSLVERPGRVHVVTTQGRSDPHVSHFARVLAEAMGASCYVNERFSSAEFLEERRINFAKNAWYQAADAAGAERALRDWIGVLRRRVRPGDLVLYLTTASVASGSGFHFSLGGEKGAVLEPGAMPLVDDAASTLQAVRAFTAAVAASGLPRVAERQTYGPFAASHVCTMLRRQGAAVLALHVSLDVLQFQPLAAYYRAIAAARDAFAPLSPQAG